MSLAYYNPYSGSTFVGFFFVLLQRLWFFLSGQIGLDDLVADEIQIIVLIGVASSAALVGSFLVLRRMTMLANSLSHTILLGIVAAFIFTHTTLQETSTQTVPLNISAMLTASIGVGLLTTFLTEFLTKTVRLQEDASTGLVFTTLFALGIVLVTLLTRSAHIGTEVVMGNVDALHLDDCRLIFTVLALNLVAFFLFFKEFKITTFDPALAKSLGISVVFYNYLLMSQVSATVIGAFRAVGVLMVLAFITGPILTARLLTHQLKRMIALAILLGSLTSIAGVALARHLLTVQGVALSTSGIIVSLIASVFVLVVVSKKLFA